MNLLHGEGRQLELIAIEIEVLGFFGSHGCWSHCIVNEGGKGEEKRRDLRLEALSLPTSGALQFIFSTLFAHGPRPET